MTEIEIDLAIRRAVKELEIIVDKELESFKRYVWDYYNETGIDPSRMKKAFNEIMSKIDEREARYF